MSRFFNKILAASLVAILVITLFAGMKSVKNVKAEEVAVNLEPWTFVQGGDYTSIFGNYEPENKGIINTVTMNGTKEIISGWLESGGGSIGQKQTAKKVSDGFSLNIANTGYDCQWKITTGFETDRINPWSVQAYMDNVSIVPGHIYTVSFKASSSKKKYAYVAFGCDVEGTTPYAEDEVKGSNQIITLDTKEKTFTYTFTNWVCAKKLTTNLMFGAFMAQYDYAGTDISDIVTETEYCWSGSVDISEFKIIDEGVNPEVPTVPERPSQGITETSTVSSESDDSNIASDINWSSFSVCTKEDHKDGEDGSKAHPWCWYHSLTHFKSADYPDGLVEGKDFATKGYVTAGATASAVQFYVANSGWDGAYNSTTEDNPYGLRFFTNGFPVEKGRTYDVSFKIKSELTGRVTLRDDTGNEVRDEYGNTVTKTVTTKHILMKAYNPALSNESDLTFTSANGCTVKGMIETDSVKGEKTVTAKILVPDNYEGNMVALDFACGAFLKTYPDEIAMTGSIYIEDFQVVAGEYEEQKEPIAPQNITVSSTSYNTISVSWSETDLMRHMGQTYNVYLDGQLVLNNVNCGGYTLANIAKGQHKIYVEALYDGRSAQSDVKEVSVAGRESVLTNEKREQTINAKDVVKKYGTKSFQLNVTTSGNGNLTFNSSNTKVVTVSQEGKVTIKGCGKAVITINAGETSECKTAVKKISIIINPKKALIRKVNSPSKAKLKISWEKDKKATGYQVQISTNKKFKKGVMQRYFNKNQTNIRISLKNKSGKKYYVRIRSYKRSEGMDYYGAWSKVKQVRIK